MTLGLHQEAAKNFEQKAEAFVTKLIPDQYVHE
jgi:hypothetical protein